MNRMTKIEDLRLAIEMHRGSIKDAANAARRPSRRSDLAELHVFYEGLIAEKQAELDVLLAEEVA